MDLLFLGTSSMVPTKDRNHSSILLSHNQEHILIDCGEGTQRQLRIANFSATRITRILITHWHGDHTFGLLGLLQTLAANHPEHKVYLYGPKGSQEKCHLMFQHFFVQPPNVEVVEIEQGEVFSTEELTVTALPLHHSVPCIGFCVQEKDRRKIHMNELQKKGVPEGPLLKELQKGNAITYKDVVIKADEVSTIKKGVSVAFLFDTALCQSCTSLAEKVTCLVAEATYEHALVEKAEEYLHMTATQAATVAAQANVQQLILTHFSQRYKDVTPLLEEAQAIFPNTSVAHDFMKVHINSE